MRIFIKCLTDKSIELDVQPSDTIENVKIKILAKHIPPEQHPFFNLFYGGRQLAGGRTISEHNIPKDSNLFLRLVLPNSVRQTKANSCLMFNEKTNTKVC